MQRESRVEGERKIREKERRRKRAHTGVAEAAMWIDRRGERFGEGEVGSREGNK